VQRGEGVVEEMPGVCRQAVGAAEEYLSRSVVVMSEVGHVCLMTNETTIALHYPRSTGIR